MEHVVAIATAMGTLWALTDLGYGSILAVGGLLVAADCIFWLLGSTYTAVERNNNPIVVNEWVTKSASAMAEAIKRGEVSSEELVLYHIEAIKAVNPAINALVAERFEEALEEARKKDIELQSSQHELSDLPIFHGVPCTVKECFEVKGMPHTAGLKSREGRLGKTHSPAVQKMIEGGFVILGVTNTSELCMWWESNNQIYGRTSNPHDISRIVGGSSGGEGAIVAACCSPAGLGSDVGGSIRMPAFFNGVFGHKPSSGMVDNTGQHPNAEREAVKYLCTGPICRHAEDLYPFMQLLHATLEAVPLKDPTTVNLGSIKFFDGFDNLFGITWLLPRPSQSLQDAHDRVRGFLEAKKYNVELLKMKEFYYSFDIWTSSMSLGSGKSFRHHLEEGGPKNMLVEFFRWLVGTSEHTLPAIVFAMVENVPKWIPGRTARMVEDGIKLRKRLEDTLSDNGVLLVPSHARPAYRHNLPLVQPFSFSYAAIFNVLQMPVTQVPIGIDSNGLPLGIQVVAAHGNDHLCLAVAAELEKVFGGWSPPAMLATS